MPVTAWPIIAESLRRRCTFGEVAMLDLAWTSAAGAVTAGAVAAGGAARVE
jgi:hypothetical protein